MVLRIQLPCQLSEKAMLNYQLYIDEADRIKPALIKTIIINRGQNVSAEQMAGSFQMKMVLTKDLMSEVNTALNEGKAKLSIDTEETLAYEIYNEKVG